MVPDRVTGEFDGFDQMRVILPNETLSMPAKTDVADFAFLGRRMAMLVPSCRHCGNHSYVYGRRLIGAFEPVACGVCGAGVRAKRRAGPYLIGVAFLLVLAGLVWWFAHS
jgi:hypothetical protein